MQENEISQYNRYFGIKNDKQSDTEDYKYKQSAEEDYKDKERHIKALNEMIWEDVCIPMNMQKSELESIYKVIYSLIMEKD